MPEKKPVSWEAIQLGSFVHLILEEGVKRNWKALKEFVDYSKDLHINKILPMPFQVNYRSMRFMYLPYQLKNQWTTYFNMYLLKKFIQYNR